MNKYPYFSLSFLLLQLMQTINTEMFLNFVTDKDFSDGKVQSIDWHTVENYTFLSYVGKNNSDRDIRIAKLKNMNMLDVRAEINLFENETGKANAVAWTTSGPRYLAVGGENDQNGKEIKVYNYKVYQGGNLERRAHEHMACVNSLDWLRCNNVSYLAVGGFDDHNGQELRVYAYVNDTLMLVSSATWFHGEVNSVKWLIYGGAIYLAVGGYEIGLEADTNTRIYTFDTNTGALVLLDAQSYNFDPIASVAWIVNGASIYLATTGKNQTDNTQVRVYDFNGANLNLVASQSFDYGAAFASDWLLYQGNMYLAVCGDDGIQNNQVRIYSFDGSSLTTVASLSLSNEIPLSVKWQFVNGLPLLAIGTNGDRALKLYSFSS